MFRKKLEPEGPISPDVVLEAMEKEKNRVRDHREYNESIMRAALKGEKEVRLDFNTLVDRDYFYDSYGAAGFSVYKSHYDYDHYSSFRIRVRWAE